MSEQIKYVSLKNLDFYDDKIKQYIQTKDDELKSNLEGQVEIVANALDSEITTARANEAINKSLAQAAQKTADDITAYVGTFTASEGVDTVVKYIDAKTSNIASDETVTALAERVTQAESDIDAVEGRATSLETAVADRYTKAEVDTKVAALESANSATQAEVDALETVVANNKTAIETAVSTLEEKVDTNETDIEAKMTALTSRVAANETAVGTTLPNAIAAEETRATAAEADLQTQINTIMNNPDTEGVINSINEFTQYIADHGEIAEGFRTDIDANAKAISDMDAAYKAADTTLQNNINSEATARTEADTALDTRLKAVESAVGESGSVATDIADAKEEAVSEAVATAAIDATTKANQALADAKAYADAEDEKIETRVAALETASATHALASDLTALAGRVTTAEGEIDTLQTDLDAAEVKITANETAISGLNTTVATKAAQSDLEGAVTRIDALETWHENFVECEESDITALFTA